MLFVGDSFTSLIGLTVVAEVMGSPSIAIINDAVLDMLSENKSDFGKQRLWGAVGWVNYLILKIFLNFFN